MQTTATTVNPKHGDSVSENDLFSISKARIVDFKGERYLDFRKQLVPLYGVVWRDISVVYITGIACAALILYLQREFPEAFIFTILLGALALGYIMAWLQLFWHEASHYLIASDRKKNDLLANILIGSWVMQDIARYRLIHRDHHRFHGEVNDSEHSYFEPLNLRYILESLFGIKVLRVLMSRKQNLSKKKKHARSETGLLGKIVGLTLHLSIILICYATGNWQFIVTWIIAMGSVFPLFGALRQLLEHRDVNAEDDIDYTLVKHGIVNRLFGDGIIPYTFGGAGFNRHLLHHWDASVSYTRLREIEEFLIASPWKQEIYNARTTYGQTFRALYH